MTRAKPGPKPVVRLAGEAPDRDRSLFTPSCAVGRHDYCAEKLIPAGKPCICPCHDDDQEVAA